MEKHPNRQHRQQAWYWILFDTANTGYSSIMITAYFILYFKNAIIQDIHRGDFIWGKMIGTSMFIVALISPALGAIADQGYFRKKFFSFFSFLCIFCTMTLALLDKSHPTAIIFFFCLSLIAYEAALTFYDTFLGSVSTKETVGKISGLGFGFGYIGGILSIVVSYPFIAAVQDGQWSLAPLWIVVIQFVFFGTPAFLFLKDNASTAKERQPVYQSIRKGIASLKRTFSDLRHFPDLAKFLLAFLFFYDGIATVISFGGTFAKDTLGFTTKEIFLVFILSNIVAVPGSFVGGYFTDKIGGRKTILVTLVVWMLTLLALAFSQSKFAFYIVTCMVGMGLGSTQGAARALYSQIIPKNAEARFFALRSLCGKAGTILGPIVFGAISYITLNQRWAALSLLFFFVTGFILVYFVNETDAKKKALEFYA